MGLFGFSAGAYAVLELLSVLQLQPCGVGLGGLHGHGAGAVKPLPKKRRPSERGAELLKTKSARCVARERFESFLERLKKHRGARAQVVHGLGDRQCPWEEIGRAPIAYM